MNEFITNELIEATYLFCAKRISDTEAAKDLSQDILYEALRVIASGKEFYSFNSWYWKMARNKYADYIISKQNSSLPIETAGGMAAELPQPIENIIDAEEISQLNFSLSRLASIHREIIIRFYLKEQTVRQIADELGIPEGTVKRRLFDAKKNLKERFDNMNIGKTAYAPAEVDWFMGHSARKAALLMDNSKICPQVMVICRNEAKTVNEIADEMGVAPLYLEEVIEKLIKEGILISPVKGKYIANHCVFPRQKYIEAKILACDIFHDGGYAEKINNILLGLKEKITALDFYGNNFDYGYLLWLLYVWSSYSFGNHGKYHYAKKYGIKDEVEREYRLTMEYTLADENFDNSIWEKLKDHGWSCLHQDFTTSEYGKIEYVNNYEFEPFPNDCSDDDNDWCRGRDRWVDGNNIVLLVALSENPNKKLSVHEEVMAADFLKNGLLKKENDKLIVQLPILRYEIFNEICDLIYAEIKPLAEEFADKVSEGIEKILLPYVRKDLMSNFIHWDMMVFFQRTDTMFRYGWDKALAQPDDYSKSAAGLYILRN